MDTDILDNLTDCKKCHWWYEILGRCNKPEDVNCPEGVRPKRQESYLDESYNF